ncbi:hypothetical protein FJK98_16795 [Micromonospora sp. HM134]|uniref:hypothetical protein n=1 Tax=unclassified Micromonospora TaxID=2617518 RepID=UPI00119863DB|nr:MULTISPECIES: hypothetical protein [unclassified Micromonospora]QDY08601.1 hypothetical protein FJK98_16795 [Micromonospora sp. HM134]
MRLSRILMALTVGLAIVAVPTAAGAAQPQPPATTSTPQPPPDYPPTTPSLTANPTTIFLGETVVLTGTGFGPNEIVDIDVTVAPLAAAVPGQAPARRSDGTTVAMVKVDYSQPQPAPRHFTAQTDANGNFTVSYRPSDIGRITFTATGRTSGRTASTTITVLPKKKPHPHLPVTGDNLSTPLKVGGGLVGAGVVLMLTAFGWRRRHRFGMTR